MRPSMRSTGCKAIRADGAGLRRGCAITNAPAGRRERTSSLRSEAAGKLFLSWWWFRHDEVVQLPAHARRYIEETAAECGAGALKRAAATISRDYRERGYARLDTTEEVAAYLATRMPATYAATHTVLRDVRARLGCGAVESVLDIGAGPGGAALAAIQWFEPKRITLIERNARIAEAARALVADAEIRVEDFRRVAEFPSHDLVIAAYSLGEASRPELLLRLWAAARVAFVVIEPGTTTGFALVRQSRTALLAWGAHIVAPCPAANSCPIQEPDWCHFAARVERTSLHRRLKEAELNYEDEKYSYIAVARQPAAPAPARVIRRPRQEPGLIVLETCTPEGLETVRATRRDPEKFRAARRAAWGDAFPA
ncbi:MAG: methyltransferase [Terriglobia bacterium]|nr:MAG: methyltransferase [Terriglobia bacterium]